MRLLKFLPLSIVSVFAFNCSSVADFKEHNGHYYTVTKDKLTFLEAKTFAKNNGCYLAIPNDQAENDFLKLLIPTPKYAWIGIYDPNNTSNYCYDNENCAFDDSRFMTIKNQPLTYTNWAKQQPDNLVKPYDIQNGKAMVALGEHWVAMSSIDGKWADFGNHYDEYNNPVKFYALIECDKMPDCYIPPSNVDDSWGKTPKCNTQIYDDTTGAVTPGQTFDCLQDPNGEYYCPADLAPCSEEWDYTDSYVVEHTGVVRDYTDLICPDGGELVNGKCRKKAIVSHANYVKTITTYQARIQISRDGIGHVKVADCKIYKIEASAPKSWNNYNTTLWTGNEYIPPYYKTYFSHKTRHHNWVKLKCINNTIYYNTRNDHTGHNRINYYVITVDGAKEVMQCPDGYSVDYYTSWDCYRVTCPKGYSSYDGVYCYTNPTCPNNYSKEGNKCVKTINYTYYEYLCSGANKYGNPYEPIDKGGCYKTDPNPNKENPELANTCNSPTPPPNNCRAKTYQCVPAPDRKCVYVNNKWQCSPYPCVGEGVGDYNVENIDTPVGINDKKNNGWDSNGQCDGKIYIFNGRDMRCRSDDIFFGLTGGGCCDKDKVFFGLIKCKEDERFLAKKNEKKECHYIGEYCSKKLDLLVAKICIQHKQTYCCFNSKLARIIQEQGRKQLKMGWGSPKSPDCRGFTPEEFQKIDFSRIDLSEFYNDISQNISAQVQQGISNYIKDKVTNYLNDMK